MPMFPLGSVLFPRMPLPLRVFEPRYRTLLQHVLPDDPGEFGVVLIERGQEVGGGDHRTAVGTVAEIAKVDFAPDGTVLVVAVGGRRIEVTEWLDDDPYPRAEVRELPDPDWSDDLVPLRETTEATVRRALGRAGDDEARWPADVGLSDDPAAAAWQIAAIAPLGPLDQLDLLRSGSMARLLARTADLVREIDEARR